MKPVQELLPLTASGCVIEASELLAPVVIEAKGELQKSSQSWFTWTASCGAVQPDGRSSHPELAVDQGMRLHVCGSAR